MPNIIRPPIVLPLQMKADNRRRTPGPPFWAAGCSSLLCIVAVFWQEPRLGTSQPNVAACEGLCEALTEGAASRDAGATAGRVRPVCPPWEQGWSQAHQTFGSRGEPVLRLCGGRKKKRDKEVTSSTPFSADTSARSAGSFKGFRDCRKWGQKQREKEILRSLSPNACAHKEKVGVTPRICRFFCRSEKGPSQGTQIASLYQR